VSFCSVDFCCVVRICPVSDLEDYFRMLMFVDHGMLSWRYYIVSAATIAILFYMHVVFGFCLDVASIS
jgi:hypothetical protein